jgi:hypothetical protein
MSELKELSAERLAGQDVDGQKEYYDDLARKP